MATQTPLTELDFFELKEQFIGFLKTQEQYRDYNFDGSNLNVLLDVLSYNTHYNQFYNNMVMSEMFLDTAQLKNSVVSHAKELNYLPASPKSAMGKLRLVITSDQDSNIFTIPKHTKFNAICGQKTYTYITAEPYIANRTQGTSFVVTDVEVYEGKMVSEIMSINDTKILNENIDTDSLSVTVDGVEFKYTSDIFGIGATDKVFYLQPEQNNLYSIQFGENVFGYQPSVDEEIIATYRTTAGSASNGVTSFAIAEQNLNGALAIQTVITQYSAGGRDAETIESIRKFAPKALQVQERAVTKSDYEVLLKRRFPNIQAISVYGGDEVEPPQFGRVIISVDVANGLGASDAEIASYKEYLSDKTPLTIEPVFVPAQFTFINLDVTITYNKKLTSQKTADIASLVRAKILSYGQNFVTGYNSRYPQSKLTRELDSLLDAIVSTDIKAKAIIEYNPVLNRIENPSFNFANPLQQPYKFDETVGFVGYEPAIQSTTFTLDGTDVALQDDGRGNILAVTVNVPSRTVYRRNIGTVDYATGIVRLANFSVENYTGASIKIYANPSSKDIISKQDRILEIKDEDINIEVVAV